jgi:hypothetical protein
LATSPDVVIRISFPEFKTYDTYDFMHIYVCDDTVCLNPLETYRLSGEISPINTYVSRTGFLQVYFHSEHSAAEGFIGNWWATGNVQCTNCPAGKFSADEGATEASACASCAAGKYSVGGAPVCTDCGPGTYSAVVDAAAASTCVQ